MRTGKIAKLKNDVEKVLTKLSKCGKIIKLSVIESHRERHSKKFEKRFEKGLDKSKRV